MRNHTVQPETKKHMTQTVQSLSAHRGMLADTKKPRKEAGLRL